MISIGITKLHQGDLTPMTGASCPPQMEMKRGTKAQAVQNAGKGMSRGEETCVHTRQRSAACTFPQGASGRQGTSRLWLQQQPSEMQGTGWPHRVTIWTFISLVKIQKFESHVKTALGHSNPQGKAAQGTAEECPRQPHSLCPLSRQEATSALTPEYQHEEGRMLHRRRGKSICDGKHLWTISAHSLMLVRSERNTDDSYLSKRDW